MYSLESSYCIVDYCTYPVCAPVGKFNCEKVDGGRKERKETFGAKGGKGDIGPQGLTGPQGPVGPKGDTGETGPEANSRDSLELLAEIYEDKPELR